MISLPTRAWTAALRGAVTGCTTLLLATFGAIPAGAEEQTLSGALSGQQTLVLENDRGSKVSLTLRPSEHGPYFELSGDYINNAQGFGCQGTPYPLTGFVYVNGAVSFDVVWSNQHADCQSVTGWTGFLVVQSFDPTVFSMTTDWVLAYMDANGQPATLTGQDVFVSTATRLLQAVPNQ